MLIGFAVLGFKLGFSQLLFVLAVMHPLLFGGAYLLLKKLRLNGDPSLLILVGLLTGMGILVLYRIDAESGQYYWNAFSARQLMGIVFGLLTMIGVAFVFRESRRLEKGAPWLLLGSLALMILTLFFGKEAGGSRAWLSLGPFNLQPSELFKVALIVYLAAYLSRYRRQYGQTPPDWWQKPQMALAYMGPLVLMESLALVIVVIQRDLGMAMLYFGLFLLLLYDATGRPILIGVGAGLGTLGLGMAAMVFSHVRTRIDIWLHPWADASGAGFQMVQSLLAIRAGGLMGVGLGGGSPLRIPAAHTDFIFSVWAEELGLFGSIALLIIFFFLIQRCLVWARFSGNPFHQLLAVGFAGLFGLQALVIVGGTMGLFPLTGITLPFLSYGGSSIICNFAAIGILLGIARTGGGGSVAGF